MNKYSGLHEVGKQFEILCNEQTMSLTDIVQALNDLQFENDRLRQRLKNVKDKIIRFGEKLDDM
jgi:hypothetical protein